MKNTDTDVTFDSADNEEQPKKEEQPKMDIDTITEALVEQYYLMHGKCLQDEIDTRRRSQPYHFDPCNKNTVYDLLFNVRH